MAATGKAKQTQPGIRVTTKRNGFRRGGLEWHGTTELALDALTKAQLAQIEAEPGLISSFVELEIKEIES